MLRSAYLSLTAAMIVYFLIPLAVLAQDVTGDDTGPLQEDLSNVTLWLIIAGVLTSIVTAIVNRTTWASDFKLLVFTGMSIITSFVSIVISGDLTKDGWIRVLLVVFASGATFYQLTKPAVKSFEARTEVIKVA